MSKLERCWLLAAVGACLGYGCIPNPAFECTSSTDCQQGEVQGYCEAIGYCSYDDPNCEGGRRWGPAAGSRANQCIDPDAATSVADLPTITASDDFTTLPPLTTTSFGSTSLTTSDTTSASLCGNDLIEPGEDCDGLDQADCLDYGFDPGPAGCTLDCQVDLTPCSICGNDVIEGAEECDGLELAGLGCQDLGFGDGALACAPDCLLDTSGCFDCNDGTLDPGEICESGNVPLTCADIGYGTGDLLCGDDCRSFDVSMCTGIECGVDPVGHVGECPDFTCSQCIGDQCIIDCPDCTLETIVCPAGWDCVVDCSAGTCENATIVCPPYHSCTVGCSGSDTACNGTTVVCGDAGTCLLDCPLLGTACAGAELVCGQDGCGTECGGEVVPMVDCTGNTCPMACDDCSGM